MTDPTRPVVRAVVSLTTQVKRIADYLPTLADAVQTAVSRPQTAYALVPTPADDDATTPIRAVNLRNTGWYWECPACGSVSGTFSTEQRALKVGQDEHPKCPPDPDGPWAWTAPTTPVADAQTTPDGTACRRMGTRTCPPSYNGPCGELPCARFESDNPAPWLPSSAPRLTADTITDDQLGALVKRAETAERRAEALGHAMRSMAADAMAHRFCAMRENGVIQRAEQAEELLRVAEHTSNKAEAERARAVQRAEQAAAELDAETALRRERTELYDLWRIKANAQAVDLAQVCALAERWESRTDQLRVAADHIRRALGGPSSPVTTPDDTPTTGTITGN